MASAGRAVSDIPNSPQWKYRLASESEAIIQADRASDLDVTEFQEFTIQTLEKREEVENEANAEDFGNRPLLAPFQQIHLPVGSTRTSW
jgi:hypothetical protein